MSKQRAYPLIHSESIRFIMAQCKRSPEYAVHLKFFLKLCHDFMKANSITWRNMHLYGIQEVLSFSSTQADAVGISTEEFKEGLRYVLQIIKSPPPPDPAKPCTSTLSARQLTAFQFYWSAILGNDPTFVEHLLANSSSPVIQHYIEAVWKDQNK